MESAPMLMSVMTDVSSMDMLSIEKLERLDRPILDNIDHPYKIRKTSNIGRYSDKRSKQS
jgi:hypothetical protein